MPLDGQHNVLRKAPNQLRMASTWLARFFRCGLRMAGLTPGARLARGGVFIVR